MTQEKRLTSLSEVAGTASLPAYDPARHAAGIVHLGVGAFHRAHQAAYTDTALSCGGGDWRIIGISLRSTEIADTINPQNGIYTLIERGAAQSNARVVASIARVIAASRDFRESIAALTAPQTQAVSLTVTEKAYGIDRASMTIDATHHAVSQDLANPRRPIGVLGLIVESLRLRRDVGLAPFTVLCCDNLPDNGALLRNGVIDFAGRTSPETADWIAAEVSFPSSVVDRITPAPSERTFEDARLLTGCTDLAAVESESFSQWIIEDRFSAERPLWEANGALFVDDVKPYELAKLRMLNGAHSLLAYAGFLSGCVYVRDVIANDDLRTLVDSYMRAAASTLPPLPGFDVDQYRRDLLARFANPAIAHETYQIAMDGTEKLPQRILAPAADILEQGADIRPFAFAVAAWMRYCLGKDEDGDGFALRDPRETEIGRTLQGASSVEEISEALHRLPGLFDPQLANNQSWRLLVRDLLHNILESGMAATIKLEARSA